MRKTIHNILKTYDKATADELSAGLSWYKTAHDCSVALHSSPAIACGIVAAVSPGLRWERNIETADRIINGRSLDGLGVRWYDGVRKAKRILGGSNPLIALRGNKVRAFYACLLNPLNPLAVCVDGHAFGIWKGKRISLDMVPELSDKLYHAIARDYVEAARTIGILPMQIQAITWVAWRRIHGVIKLDK